jgi:pimeloyl-ACP methyl ester carboxylesterase
MGLATVRRFGLAWLAVGLTGCASLPPAATEGARWVGQRLTLGGVSHAAEWWLPEGEALGLMTLQHGFARDCSTVRETARQIARRGLMTLCVDASMAGGNPALADALAAALAAGMTAPDGQALPKRIVAGGHSAGAHFAVRLGQQLAALAPERLAGAVLFDPVAAAGFEANLAGLSAAGQRPVLAITANAAGCNARHNAYPALRRMRQDALAAVASGFVGLQLTQGSTHVDVEGEDTGALAVAACGQGRPQPENVQALRTLAAAWAHDLASGRRSDAFYPGGEFVEALLAAQRARPIE